MKNETIIDFYDVLRSEAASNPLIDSKEGEHHFFRGEANEFYNGLRNVCDYPCVVGEGFRNTYSKQGNGIWKVRETSFAVVDGYPDTNDWDQIDTVFARCETIGDSILRKLMDEYSAQGCTLLAEDVEAEQVENMQERWAGVRYTVLIKSWWRE